MAEHHDSYSKSPMTQRVERAISGRGIRLSASGIRIPKKGRIRIILLVIFCVIGIKYIFHKAPPHTAVVKQDRSQ
jgi:hypothetical protein